MIRTWAEKSKMLNSGGSLNFLSLNQIDHLEIISHELLGDTLNPFWHGSGEEKMLNISSSGGISDMFDDVFDDLLESNIEHLISFIKNKGSELAQVDAVSLD